MLQKRIDLGSIPYGLAIAGEDMQKGSAVVIKNTGKGANGQEAFLPTSVEEADSVKGFATYRVETHEGSDREHDVIKAGQWVVIYTLVKNNIWSTTEYMDGVVGDELVVDFSAENKGQLRKKLTDGSEDSRPSMFRVVEVNEADTVYLDSMVDVEVL